MRTPGPLISAALALAAIGGAAWQGIGMWSQPSSIVMPGTGIPVQQGYAGLIAANAAEIIIPRQEPDKNAAPEPSPAPAAMPAAPQAAPDVSPAASSPAPASPAGAAAQPSKPVVDETALRYFARQGDTRRLNTEIARLRSLYPDWIPPDDPLKGPTVADPQLDSLWQLYSQGQFAAARAAIAARQVKEPKWAPPKDLLDRLMVAETRERLVNASNAKQYKTVVQLATATPSLLTCGDIDVLWRVAEAFGLTDRQSRAQDAYRYILTSCTDPHDRLSTMQKAMALLPRADLEALLTLAHTGVDGDEFRSVREGLARNAVGAGGADPKVVADVSDLKLLQEAAVANNSAADATLLGSYFLQHADPAQAEHWYRIAYYRQNEAQSAEGLALALVALKRPAEAEPILAPWRDTNDNTRKSYVAVIGNFLAIQPPPPLALDVLARFVAAIAAQRDAPSAQQLGWYSHAFGQDETAARWFAAALGWKPDDEPSAYGLALASQALNRREALRAVVNAWGPRSLRIRALVDPAAARMLALQGGAVGGLPQSLPQFTIPQSQVPALAPAATVAPAPLPAAIQPTVAVPSAPGGAAIAAAMVVSPLSAAPAPAMVQTPLAAASVPQAPIATQQAAPPPAIAYQQAVTGQPVQGYDELTPAPRRTSRRQPASERSAASPSRGSCGGNLAGAWCLMKLDRPSEAVVLFRQALAGGSSRDRQDAAYGLSLAYLRLGLTSQAAIASTQAPLTTGRAKELNTSILTQRIMADYQGGRYAAALVGLDARARLVPEQTDLLMIRGWSYYHLQRFDEALRVFQAVASTGRSEALSAIVAVKDATKARY